MSLDRDYPMSPGQVKVLVVGLVIMAVFGLLLFGGFLPGLKPNYAAPSTLTIEGESYYYTTVTLSTPNLLSNFTAPQLFVFHNVSFYLWLTNWGAPSGALVHGNGTEANGSSSAFLLGESAEPRVNATLYVSPDRGFAVYWPGGFLAGPWVRLMVLA